jgi:hypothetical protein
MLHASSAGVKKIKLQGKHNVYYAATGRKLFSNVSAFELPMKRYESRILAIEKGK